LQKPELPKEMPHRVVDAFLDSLWEIPKEVSETISSALDKGPLGEAGPHRAVDRIVKGWASAPPEFGEGIAKALDHPLEAVERR